MSDEVTRLDQMINNLTSADRAWFVKFAMYMRIYGWVRDQAAVSNELMAMAQDLRDAEQDEQDAAGYFGHSPRTMAQAILRQLPLIDWGTRLKWFFALASVAWLLLLMFAAGRSAVMQLSIFNFSL
ncbi:hypothetical protein ACFQ3L_06625 [Lacticaseibacillus jixianensis]|uniref:Uncharacterized protein n=1 Tax=Lacticaseibacillus jixianensis TaxID=2486012 RepID=A0ABW4B8M3_9LACO|nr:hypothetical protein [Lacticaseibacillus jixianensis]